MKPQRSRLVLVRHGQTDYNREGRLQGQVDIPLNTTGAAQAQRLAAAVTADPPDVIVASPLQRALATAQVIGRVTSVPVTTDPAFLERSFGDWEGLRGEEIRQRWPEEHAAWRAHRTVEGVGVEDRPEVAERVAAGARRLLQEHPGKMVMVVAHGAAITLGITALIGEDPNGFRGIAGLENCHRSVLEPLQAAGYEGLMRLLSHNLPPSFA
ncbi:histidine phosphatase family protein [Brachybacterium sp. UMB0905]|uniref:histidine phosphatase family protein n=1 Tax=Brachybacterium sp. UMB0905 TaxID=2069310 RepID=UPI000C80BD69|nr:histidine phosphatase family protein [Brachybacterium sp. UMB0905]PMC74348.1 histidine phosphatase family protein [Brachybacterium sp. UMB0905]